MYRAAAQGKGAEKQRAAQALRGVSSPVWLQVCGLILCFRELPKNNLRIIYHKKGILFFQTIINDLKIIIIMLF